MSSPASSLVDPRLPADETPPDPSDAPPAISFMQMECGIHVTEYESLPMVCFYCGIYGHHKDLCPRLCPPEATSSATAASVLMANDSTNPVLADPYGPWMLVECKKRVSRNSLVARHSSALTRSIMETMQVSKFNHVFEANDMPHGSVSDSLPNKPVNPAPQESTLELLPENHALVDVISSPIDQPIVVQQITPITDDPDTKSPTERPIQRKKAIVIPQKWLSHLLAPKRQDHWVQNLPKDKCH
ncbi:hypothetical protein V6N13_050934 [Hibiscus sabdariffa]